MTKTTCKACGATLETFGVCSRHELRVRDDAPPIVRLVATLHPRTMALLGKPAVDCTPEDLREVDRLMFRAYIEIALEEEPDYNPLDSVW